MARGRKAPSGRVLNEGEVEGGRRAPQSPVSVRVKDNDPFRGTPNYRIDTRGLQFPSVLDDVDDYLTTHDIARALNLYATTVFRWCKIWFGPLPVGRAGGRRQGYRIPQEYLYIARAWKQTEDHRLRELVRWALIDDLKDYVVVCGNVASTHYHTRDTSDRLQQLFGNPMMSTLMTTVIYVGPVELKDDGSLTPHKRKWTPKSPTRKDPLPGKRVSPQNPRSTWKKKKSD